ncbi:hypothetical protein [Plasmodium yoelii yoelii]|uniref:Fam-b protein n=1 Tax=Plasmodium yoelii yoelii TaxID=73239 RepID=Q7RTE6_PLAYO|nr:hypothetical protein [Plasmodium yoelii yoelii]
MCVNKYFISFQELYFVNDRGIYLERNVINFRNNRILSDADNHFDLNEFYQSTLNLANQFNEYNDDDKEIVYIRNAINSHIKKCKESNTLLNLKNVDIKAKKIINKFRKELEKLTKELDNKINDELGIQSIHDKIIIKKDENSSVSKHEDFKQFENDKYNEITSSSNYKKLKTNRNLKKKVIKCILACLASIVIVLAVIPGPVYLMTLYILLL